MFSNVIHAKRLRPGAENRSTPVKQRAPVCKVDGPALRQDFRLAPEARVFGLPVAAFSITGNGLR
jgi:hypothetical protein